MTPAPSRPVVTFDLFSALLDSRSGGSAFFARLAAERGWREDGVALYDRWDARNKQAHRDCPGWVPYRDLAAAALTAAYDDLGVRGDAADDVRLLLESMRDWPLWPDVGDGLAGLRPRFRIGLLSNVDDELFRSTRAAPLVDASVAFTSQRLRAYKPSPLIYRRAVENGADAHVAASARDVRGALEAGVPVVRLVRPGHALDPDGPVPAVTVDGVGELGDVLDGLAPAVAVPSPRDSGTAGEEETT